MLDYLLELTGVSWALNFAYFLIITIALYRSEKKEEIPRSLFFFMFFWFVIPSLSFPVSFYAFGMAPPGPIPRASELLSSSEQKLALLETSASRLRHRLKNPQKLTLSEINSLATEINLFTGEANIALKEREQAIDLLRQELAAEKAQSEKQAILSKEIRNLSRQEIANIGKLIAADAKRSSAKSFLYGALISFPLGVLSSFMASLYQARKRLSPGRQ